MTAPLTDDELRQFASDGFLLVRNDLEIHPAHFAGSACGAGMSGKPSSTIAFEKKWFLRFNHGRSP